MSEERVRDLLKGLGDAVVPLEAPEDAERARARALPRLEAALRAAGSSNARRARTRRVAFAVGIAAALAVGVASAAMLSRPSRPTLPAATGVAAAIRASSSERLLVVARSAAPPSQASEHALADASGRPAAEPSPAEAPAPRAAQIAASKGGAATSPIEASTLAAQNQLFASALDARRRGDDKKALVLLNELLHKYPSSPLAQEVRVERLRCLQRMGQRGAATDEARRYLADYPEGFAREEAKGQALPAPGARTPAP